MRYATYDIDPGPLLRVNTCSDSDFENQLVMQTITKYVLLPEGDDTTHYIKNGEATAYPEKPSKFCEFDYVSFIWFDTRVLADYQQTKWNLIKSKREELTTAGFPYLGKVFDSDAVSVIKINTAVGAANKFKADGELFELTWTTQDNSTIVLSMEDILGLPVALAIYGNQLQEISTTIRQQIYAEDATIDSVNAIEWPSA